MLKLRELLTFVLQNTTKQEDQNVGAWIWDFWVPVSWRQYAWPGQGMGPGLVYLNSNLGFAVY